MMENVNGISVLVFGLLSVTTAIDVEINDEVVVMCPLDNVEYPEWKGPATLTSPITNGSEINEPGIEWVANKDLKILSAQTKHTGQYTCSSGDREGIGNPTINVLSYNITVQFLNVETEEGSDTERVVGQIDTEMTVNCQVIGGNPAPEVSFAFEDTVENPPELGTPEISKQMTDTNTYSVNASVTFTANASIDYKNIICKASYPNKDPVEAQVLVYLLYPPTEFGSTVHQDPSLESNQMVLSCNTSSRPETTFNWNIDGKNMTDSGLAVTENYQDCTQNSSTRMYFCMSNITIIDITKEDTGKIITCDYMFRGEKVKTSPEQRISMPFRPSSVAITGDATGVVDSSGSTTLTLTCSAGPANPAATLRWYLGAENETLLESTYDVAETEDMYDGKNVSQNIDILANRTMNGVKVVCCADLNVCTNVTLIIQYPPQLLAPQLPTYRAYVGDNISIPCIADSSPVANIAWYRVEGEDSTELRNNSDNPINVFYLEVVNISMSDAVQYQCKAWSPSQDASNAVSKSTTLIVVERPADPTVETTFDAEKYYIEIKTSATAPTTPRQFYIQYKRKDDSSWLEVGKGFEDTLPGQDQVTYSYGFKKSELTPDSEYEFRVKSVDENGLVSYSATSRLMTDKEVVPSEDDTVSMTKYRNAIIISVFATAALFLIILVVIACAVKSGKCGASSSKSYVM